MLVGFAAAAPFARMPLTELNAFFPSLDAIVFVTGLITSVLLFTRLSISYSRSLLTLAIGYLFTALIVIPHALTFGGAFSPTGLLGAGIQTGSWLFIFWHVGFALALLAYAVLREEAYENPVFETSALPAIGLSVVGVTALVCGLTWLSTAGVTLLPTIIADKTHISSLVIYPISFTLLIFMAALAGLLIRWRSVLDQWLIVVVLVSILELIFSGLLPSVRFSLGFYAGRVLSLVTSSIVLIVLLTETTVLYARSARANNAERYARERRLNEMEAVLIHLSRTQELGQNVSTLIHEIAQPLAAISMLAQTTNVAQRHRRLSGPHGGDSLPRALDLPRRRRNFHGGRPPLH
jgi:hypothetical protein